MKNNTTVYSFERYPNRGEAVEFLNQLISSGLLNEVMSENLKEIKTCIEYERKGIDLYGASYRNVAPLIISNATLEYSPELVGELEEIHARYHMEPRRGSIIFKNGLYVEVPDKCRVHKEGE